MINLALEKPMDNVNRLLAGQQLLRFHTPEELWAEDSRIIQSFIEVGDDDIEKVVKELNLIYVLYEMPTIELKYLMEKLSKKAALQEIKDKTGTKVEEDKLPIPE